MAVRFSARCAILLALMLAVSGPGDSARAQPPPWQTGPEVVSPEEAVRLALLEPVDLAWDETPLEEVAASLEKSLGVPIRLDLYALDEFGLDGSLPITFRVSGISARSAIRLMLRQHDLIYVIVHEMVLITTPEQAERQCEARVYDVADLVVVDEAGARADDFDRLMGMFVCTIDPLSWEDAGGPGTVSRSRVAGTRALIVRQTPDAHEQIETLLADLRAVRGEGAGGGGPGDRPRLIERRRAAEEAIRRVLDGPATLDFDATPLAEVVESLGKTHGIPMVIDVRALDEWGLETSMPVTAHLNGITLRSALDFMLGQLDMGWGITDEVLLITTPYEVSATLQAKVYDVYDVLGCGPREEAIDHRLENAAFVQRYGGGMSRFDYGSLIETIWSCIDGESWEVAGGTASISRFQVDAFPVLVVSQTLRVHEKVESLLAEMGNLERSQPAENTRGETQPQQPAEVAIREALDQPVDLALVEKPLEHVAASLEKTLGVPVRLDLHAMAEFGLDGREPITLQVSGISARSAMALLLRPLDLTYVIAHEMLLITTPERAWNMDEARVYDVTDLVGCPSEQASAGWDGLGGLMDLIVCTIEPDSWDEAGGCGSVEEFETPSAAPLVVCQTQNVHGQLERLLAELRSVGSAEDDAPASAEDAIREALRQPVDLALDETPLSQVAASLEKRLGVPVQVDLHALDEFGLDGSMPVTFRLSGISAHSALRLMLRPVDLTYVIAHEVVLITTTERALNTCEARVYDVADLVVGPDEDGWAASGRLGDLIESIVCTIDPASWEDYGGPACLASFQGPSVTVLVASQTRDGHEQVERLLAELRRASRDGSVGGGQAVRPRPAGTPGPEDDDPPPSSEEAIGRALAGPVTLDFDAKPLDEVLESLGQRHGISIAVDVRALDEIGMPPSFPVTAHAADVSLQTALEAMLERPELTWDIKAWDGDDEVLLITTAEEDEFFLRTRVYDVADLPCYRGARGQGVPDYQRMIETIISCVDPESWEEAGGPASIGPFDAPGIRVLVVWQTPRRHREVQLVLDILRELLGPPPDEEALGNLPPAPWVESALPAPVPAEATEGIVVPGGGMW